MAIEINTIVSVGQQFGPRGIPNISLEDSKFFGRPNFAGEKNRFKEEKRQFTVLIPNDIADQLRQIGYNVKTNIPTPEELREYPDRVEISHLKVAVDDSSNVYVKMGEDAPVKLSEATLGVIDNSRIRTLDMELRGWMYNKDEVAAGEEQPKYSARLVQLVAVLEPNLIQQKYGNLG
jgi:hypothetical protein